MRWTCSRCRCTRGFDFDCTMNHSCAGGLPPDKSMAAPPVPGKRKTSVTGPGPSAEDPRPEAPSHLAPKPKPRLPFPAARPPLPPPRCGLCDPPASAPRRPPSSVPFRRCSGDKPFLLGVVARGGTGRDPATPPSPSTSQPGPLDKLAWAAGWLKGALETKGGKERRLSRREKPGRVVEATAFHHVLCPGVKVNFLQIPLSSKERRGRREELVSETLF